MKTKVLRIVEDHPEIHQKLELLLSESSFLQQPAPGESQSHDQNMVPRGGDEGGDGGDEDSLLSDEVMDTLARDFSECDYNTNDSRTLQ